MEDVCDKQIMHNQLTVALTTNSRTLALPYNYETSIERTY